MVESDENRYFNTILSEIRLKCQSEGSYADKRAAELLNSDDVDIENELALAMMEINQNERDLSHLLEVASFMLDQNQTLL